MEFFRTHRLLSLGLFVTLCAVLIAKVFLPNSHLQAQTAQDNPSAPTPPDDSGGGDLGSEIDYFLNQVGATGYLVWQYSGSHINPIGNDNYSFFEGDAPCKIMHDKAASLPAGKFIGVNMHDLAQHPDQIGHILDYLGGQCGVTMIRIWGNADVGGAAAVKNVLDQAQAHHIQVIVVAADYANQIGPAHPNPTDWYASGYRNDYLPYLTQLASAIANHPALYAIELANEPHCAGQQSCSVPYAAWAAASAGAIRGKAPHISIGQMANSDFSLGDSPGPGDFARSNSASAIDITTGHYYDSDQRAKVIQSAGISKGLGKPFYVGEAPPRVDKKVKNSTYFEHNIQRDDADKILNNFYNEYSVSCVPKEEYQLAIENALRCDLSKNPNARCDANWFADWNKIQGSLQFTANGKMFGLFRNEAQASQRASHSNSTPLSRLESIESFLTVHNPFAADSNSSTGPGTGETSFQAPLYKLTTMAQQCEIIKSKLLAVKELCKPENRIEGDDPRCAVDNNIPGTSYAHQTDLLNDIGSRDCKELMSSTTPADKKLQDAIHATSPTMELAYRPAFIVAVTEFDGNTKNGENVQVNAATGKDKLQEFRQDGKFMTVDYLEVKVPSFGSDFLPSVADDSTRGDTIKVAPYRDPLALTADTLRVPWRRDEFEKAALAERQTIKQAGGPTPIIKGPMIGNFGEPVFCSDKDGNLTKCDLTPADKKSKDKDKLPATLVSFLNAVAASGTNSDLPCNMDEENFYPDPKKKMIAEQIRQKLGSLLDAKDVGIYKKKTDIRVGLSVDVKDIRKPSDVRTNTKLYFVSPHHYTVKWARDSFMAFVAQDQQQLIAQKLIKGDQINAQEFSPLLKTETSTKVDGPKTTRGEQEFVPGGQDQPTDTQTPNQPPKSHYNHFDIIAFLKAPLGENSTEKKHSLFWNWAGQAASFPTRLMALVTTTTNHPLNIYTRSCEGDFATEDWLTGKCSGQVSPLPESSCKPSSSTNVTVCKNQGGTCAQCDSSTTSCNTTSANGGTGSEAKISDGVIALALQVSKYTCMPAEVLVGVMAKESRGLTFVNGQDQVVKGDANEVVTRDVRCDSLNLSNPTDGSNYIACGAYQYAQFSVRDQIQTYGAGIQPCLDGLGLSAASADTRKLGYSMCVAAANMWRSTYCSKVGGCPFALRATSYGCGGGSLPGNLETLPQQAYSLSDLMSKGFSEQNIRAGMTDFHGESGSAIDLYWSFIQQYKSQVEKVRSNGASCSP